MQNYSQLNCSQFPSFRKIVRIKYLPLQAAILVSYVPTQIGDKYQIYLKPNLEGWEGVP